MTLTGAKAPDHDAVQEPCRLPAGTSLVDGTLQEHHRAGARHRERAAAGLWAPKPTVVPPATWQRRAGPDHEMRKATPEPGSRGTRPAEHHRPWRRSEEHTSELQS